MAKQSVFIATPTIDGALDCRYVGALISTIDKLKAVGIDHRLDFEMGNSIISDARNKQVARFLDSDYSDLMFIDSDIVWKPDDLLRLIGRKEPLVAATYQRKNEAKVSFAIKFGPEIVRKKGLIAVERVGTGFMRIKRSCLEELIAAYPDFKLSSPSMGKTDNYYALFDNSIVDGEYVGEDFTFCNRWRALGGQVNIDPAITLTHLGTASYNKPITDFLK